MLLFRKVRVLVCWLWCCLCKLSSYYSNIMSSMHSSIHSMFIQLQEKESGSQLSVGSGGVWTFSVSLAHLNSSFSHSVVDLLLFLGSLTCWWPSLSPALADWLMVSLFVSGRIKYTALLWSRQVRSFIQRLLIQNFPNRLCCDIKTLSVVSPFQTSCFSSVFF